MSANRPAVVEKIEDGYGVCVRYGDEPHQVEWLTGLARPKDVKVGDRGSLVWVSGLSYGFWVFEKQEETIELI